MNSQLFQTDSGLQEKSSSKINSENSTSTFFYYKTHEKAKFTAVIQLKPETLQEMWHIWTVCGRSHVNWCCHFGIPVVLYSCFGLFCPESVKIWWAGHPASPLGCVTRHYELRSTLFREVNLTKLSVIQYHSLKTSQPTNQMHRLLSIHGLAMLKV